MRTLFFLTILITIPRLSWGLSLPEFIGIYKNSSEGLKESRSASEKAQAEFNKSDDLFRNELTLTPTYSQTTTDLSSSTSKIRESGAEVTTTLSQKTPMGLDVKFSATKLFPSESNLDISSQNYSLGLTQSLFRNSFGFADRAAAQGTERLFRASVTQLSLSQIQACEEATNLYLQTWAAVEKDRLYVGWKKTAEQALDTTEKTFKKRLVRKIDLLSARSDFLRISDESTRALAEKRNRSSELQTWTKLPVVELKKPGRFDEISVLDSGDSPTLKALRETQEGYQLLSDSAQNSSRSKVDLTVAAGQEKGLSSTGPSGYTSDWVKAGIIFSFPLIDKTYHATERAAAMDAAIAEIRYEKGLRDFQIRRTTLKNELDSLSAQYANHLRRLEYRKEQAQEAFQLLKNARIEFEDYIRIRDLYLSEELQGISIQTEGWRNLGSLSTLVGDASSICQDVKK